MNFNENKDKIRKYTILGLIAMTVILYIAGIITQLKSKSGSSTDTWQGENLVQQKLSFSPPVAIYKALTEGQVIIGICIALVIVAIFYMYTSRTKEENMDERNFKNSKKGTYGTAGWMKDFEKKEIVDIKSVEETTGTILGMEKDGKVISLPLDSPLNKHTAIYGASGTGKSRCFSRPQILQCSARGESIIVTDPKGELYADTATYLLNLGYNVKVFNLVDPQYSDSWNCLGEIAKDPNQMELMAQTFCDVVIKNTSGAKSDHFWDSAEMSLLKGLCLYVVGGDRYNNSEKNIGTVYELLTNNDDRQLGEKFGALPDGHSSLPSWNIYRKAGDNVRGNIIIGLGARLQVFQADIIKKITQFNEIDMELPAREKCAYFVIMSDQESTLNFLSSLFFSFLFIRLVKYADVHGKGGKCDVPVNFILDEFPNIGQIPDFTKKLSTIRSRDLRVAIIFQTLSQLQNRYPDGLWEEIIGNCDTQLFLGCTDQTTAEYISSRTGEMTIEVSSTAVNRKSIAVAEYIPTYKETSSVGKRFLLTPDEVLRLGKRDELIILRGQNVLKTNKFDYSNHPRAANFIESLVRNHVPEWRKDTNKEKVNIKKTTINNPLEIPVSENAIPKGVVINKNNEKSTGIPPSRKIKPLNLEDLQRK